jgi:hypothetical protein
VCLLSFAETAAFCRLIVCFWRVFAGLGLFGESSEWFVEFGLLISPLRVNFRGIVQICG